jgi:hypothetical protein
MRRLAAAAGLVLACAAPAAAQASHLLVIVGLGGEPDTADLFHRWAVTLVDAARARAGLPVQSVIYLGEDPARDPARISGRSTRSEIEAAAGRLADRCRPGDRVFIVLIGHGASAEGEARFNLPGPDMTALEFARLAGRFSAQTVTFVNTASSSGAFIGPLAGANRAVITATRNQGERNQTRFGEFFVEALAGADGDIDKDGRVSMAEAFTWARRRVEESYKRDGQLQTEHALLDDNGDGQGTDAPDQPGGDGALARTLCLTADSGTLSGAASADPALRQLYDERRALEDRIAALKAAKAKMEPARYERDLEDLLVALARKTREIRDKEKK